MSFFACSSILLQVLSLFAILSGFAVLRNVDTKKKEFFVFSKHKFWIRDISKMKSVFLAFLKFFVQVVILFYQLGTFHKWRHVIVKKYIRGY